MMKNEKVKRMSHRKYIAVIWVTEIEMLYLGVMGFNLNPDTSAYVSYVLSFSRRDFSLQKHLSVLVLEIYKYISIKLCGI